MPRRTKNLLRGCVLRSLTIAGFVFLSGILCATLVRFAPGFSVDERELDARLSSDSLRALRSQHDDERNVAVFYGRYMAGLLHGDLGSSRLFSQPISKLIKDRAPTSARNIVYGLGMGWSFAFVLALAAVVVQKPETDFLLSTCAGALISVPTAVVALFIMILRKPASVAVAAALVPVLYRYSRNILQQTWVAPWITAARAKGLGSAQILFRHSLPVAAPQLITLGAVSLNMAFSAALPVEVVADSPGVGQLVWQAALGRDLPLLVTVTGLLATITLLANAGATLVNEAIHPVEA
jgi:peptide/nickel transport system permease protein